MFSFIEVLFAGVLLWMMWEFFRIVEEQEKWNREDEIRREKEKWQKQTYQLK